MFNIISTKL